MYFVMKLVTIYVDIAIQSAIRADFKVIERLNNQPFKTKPFAVLPLPAVDQHLMPQLPLYSY